MTFPPGDVATLAGLLMDVRTDPERWRAAGLRAKSEVSSRFSPGASAAALLDLAERLLAAQ
jgi:glycosyltransferase involved in cell wall biosynthesis